MGPGALYPIVHSVSGAARSLTVKSVAERSISYFGTLHTEQERKIPALRKPKVTYIGKRNLNFHLHDLRDRRLPLALGSLCYQASGNEKMKLEARCLSSLLKKINHIFPYYTHHTFDFALGRSWSETIGEQVQNEIDAEEYLGVILEGVKMNLLKM